MKNFCDGYRYSDFCAHGVGTANHVFAIAHVSERASNFSAMAFTLRKGA